MKTQHDVCGGLIRCDYNGSYIWRIQWMRNTLKLSKEIKDKHNITMSKILRCGILGEHKFVRFRKLFYTSCECLELNVLRCDNEACPQEKYVVEQWGISKYPTHEDFKDMTNDTTNSDTVEVRGQ